MNKKTAHRLARIFAWSVVGMMAIDQVVDTGPLVCSVDPTCRKMTADEIDMARPVFGDNIPYDKVLIFQRPPLYKIFSSNVIASAKGMNIYLGPAMEPHRDDYGYALYPSWKETVPRHQDHAGIFIHELTHVWQHKRFGQSYNEEEMDYYYTLTPGSPFSTYNIEQQAEIVHHYFEKRRDIADLHTYMTVRTPEAVQQIHLRQTLMNDCKAAHEYEAVLKPVLPVQPLAACTAPLKPTFP